MLLRVYIAMTQSRQNFNRIRKVAYMFIRNKWQQKKINYKMDSTKETGRYQCCIPQTFNNMPTDKELVVK